MKQIVVFCDDSDPAHNPYHPLSTAWASGPFGGEQQCGMMSGDQGSNWVCTRVAGHTGAHVGHFDEGTYGKTWQPFEGERRYK